MKKIIAIALSITVMLSTFTGCSGNNDEVIVLDDTDVSQQMGRYIETEILTGGGKVLELYTNADGNIDYYTSNQDTASSASEIAIKHITIATDGTITENNTDWFDEVKADFNMDIYYISAIKDKESIYLILQSSNESYLDKASVYKVTGETVTLLPINFDMSQGIFALSLQGIYDDNLIIGAEANNRRTSLFSQEGEEISYIDDSSFGHIIGDEFHMLGYYKYSLPSFEKIEELLQDGIMCLDGEDAYYLLDSGYQIKEGKGRMGEKTLSRYLLNGATQEIILKGNLYSFGAEDVSMIASDGKDNIYMVMGESLYKYSYDANVPTFSENSIDVFSLEFSDTIQNSIMLWNQENPDTEINYTVGMDNLLGQTKDDIIKQLNTELIAGKGPDIIILDGMPVESMMEKGFLKDITGLIDTEDILSNMTEAYTKDGKIFAIPTNFSTVLLGGTDEKDIEFSSLDSFAERMESENSGEPKREKSGKNSYGNSVAGALLESVFLFCDNADIIFDGIYPGFSSEIWKDNKFNEEVYKGFLTNTQRIIQHSEVQTINQGGELVEDEYSYDKMENMFTEEGWYGGSSNRPIYQDIRNSGTGFYEKEATVYLREIIEPFGMFTSLANSGTAENNGDGKAVLAPMVGYDNSGYYKPVIVAGVNQNADDSVAEFINTMLTDTMQGNLGYQIGRSIDALPVNKTSLSEAIDNIEKSYPHIDMQTDLMAMLEGLKATNTNQFLHDIARETTLKFYEGEYTIDEAVTALAKESSIYLAELQ